MIDETLDPDYLASVLALANAAEAIFNNHRPKGSILIDWVEFWATEGPGEEWVIEPLVPAGRSVALYAPAKTGKSLILLSAIAAAATGRPVWGQAAQRPRHILYLDYEMTENDLKERLELLGYGPDHDFTHLHYALVPALPPLDTPKGGETLLEIATACNAEAVVIDTFGRAAQGDENDADTVRAFYRHTGQALKRAGISVLRTDHAGKDSEKGQRGSSAKNDDVDVVIKMDRTDSGVVIKRTHSRITWYPETVTLDRYEDDEAGVWEFRRAGGHGWPPGTKEAAAALDGLGAPLDISQRAASQLLRDSGHRFKNAGLRAGIKWRRLEAENGRGAVRGAPISTPSVAFTGRETENTF